MRIERGCCRLAGGQLQSEGVVDGVGRVWTGFTGAWLEAQAQMVSREVIQVVQSMLCQSNKVLGLCWL